MENNFRVFSERYNRILDLIEKVDENLAKKYKAMITKLPIMVKDKFKTNKEFECESLNFKAALDEYSEMLAFEYITYDKFLCTTVNIYPFYEGDLLDDSEDEDYDIYVNPEYEEEDSEIFIFSLNFANTEGEPMVSPVFEEQDGKVVYTGTVGEGVEIQYEVLIEKENEQLFLVSKRQ